MDKHNIEALRLQLLANGYSPIRNVDKRTFFPSWPTVTLDEAEIKSWTRKHSRHDATGLRVENGLAVIDFDVDDEAAMVAIIDAVSDAHPELADAMMRVGKGSKEAWFLRCDESFTRLHSRSFIRPGQSADDETHRVEIFGGGSPRQFGAFGAHTKDEQTGDVKIEYAWLDEISPATVPLSQVVEVPKAVLWSVVDIVEEVLLSLGWSLFERSKKGESASGRVFDILPDKLFRCNDDVTRSVEELRAAVEAGEEHLRCSASWLEGPTAVNTSRCLVSLARSGHLSIWESMEGVTHLEKIDEPTNYGEMIDRLAEHQKEKAETRRHKIKSGDECLSAALKMREMFAYCPAQKQSVVPMWAKALDVGYMMQPFRLMFLPNCMEDVGPRGGVKKVNPVDLWMADEQRVTVEGLRMRPDKPRPVFEEDGARYINVYAPPAHTTETGDARPGVRFIEHLLPNPVERDWFLKWLSFKLQYPHIPGPAVVMVAHATFGTGRGTLAELVSRLFGAQYVRQLSYKAFTGKTYQSQYNDWQSEALVAYVNESSEADGGSVYQTKVNTYEHLKEIVEVRPTMRQISIKGDKNYWSMSSTSFLIFTNHMDALPIPEHDRRFGILKNGQPRPVEYWQALNMWMEDPANVSAFYHWMVGYDIVGYSPYAAPPMFEGKAAMIDEAKSDLDRAIELALLNMPGDVFTLNQMEKMIKLAADADGMIELPRPFGTIFAKVARKRFHRVGIRDGKNWSPMLNSKRYSVYAATVKASSDWTDADAEELRGEIEKNGAADGGGSALLSGIFKLK